MYTDFPGLAMELCPNKPIVKASQVVLVVKKKKKKTSQLMQET